VKELSPAAQAVLDAFSERYELCGPFDGNWQELCLAAALRAAADQVCLRWAELQHPADVLNAIADELEKQ
jgi:hypothetical protein